MTYAPEPIAVVGMACRLPGAHGVEEFWQNLVAGGESIDRPTDDELRRAGVTEEELANPDYVRAVALMPDFDRFDADLFRMTRREAEMCDPQIRAFLELTHGALENAGYDPFGMVDSVGVFGAVGSNGYLTRVLRQRPDLIATADMLTMTLNQPDYLATLAAYKMDLRGPAMTVLSACSSTLVAVHLACHALRQGECDAAVAGGSRIAMPPGRGQMWSPGSVHTPDGHCRPFDAEAAGTLFGSGAGMVVLKRLDDAVADGDNIRAVILASAVNNDGAQKVSFSAPSIPGQVAALTEAMTLAGVAPADIGYVEAHATGTTLGDPIEVAALTEAYTALSDEPLPPGRCYLGSVKGNVGHMDEAAGIVGFIKAVLALERGAIPATANLKTPNPRLNIEQTPFTLNTQLVPWPRTEKRRLAGVTSLGVGGTNAHLILAEAPEQAHEPDDGRPRVVVWSAGSEQGERQARERLGDFFGGPGRDFFADAVATLQHGRTEHPVRAAVVCDSAAAASAALTGAPAAPALITGQAAGDCRVAYLLPGQGAQHVGMATGLYGTVRPFTIAMDECLELFEELGVPLYKQWTEATDETALADTRIAQPLLFSVEYSLTQTWRSWGVDADAVLGHSLGELTGAAVAGVFELPDVVRLVAARAAAMAEHPVTGGMLAAGGTEEQIAELLTGPLAVAAVNGERQVVVSGPDAELRELAARLQQRGISARELRVGGAFHHPGWAAAAAAWAPAFDGVKAAAPTVPFFSVLTGAEVDADQLADPAYWTGQLTAPVRFHDALTALLATRPRVLLEAGPRRTLSALARSAAKAAGAEVVASLPDGRRDNLDMLEAVARLWVAGATVDWGATGQPTPTRKVPLPGYPYDRTRYWADPLPPADDAGQAAKPAGQDVTPALEASSEQEAETVVASPDETAAPVPAEELCAEIRWVERPRSRAADRDRPGDRALVVLPEDEAAALTVLLAVQRAGMRPVRVRHGVAFAERRGEFTVRSGELADLERVLGALGAAGTLPDVIVHAAGVGAAPGAAASSDAASAAPDAVASALDAAAERLDSAFADLLATCRLVLTSGQWPAPPRLILLSSGSVDVSGADPIQPDRAALHSLIRTVRDESPGLMATAVDIDVRVGSAELAAELATERPAPLVALRGRRRWVPVTTRLRLPAAVGRAVRDSGVYLVTGGTGGLGLEIAGGLAGTGLRPRLALLGRRGAEAALAPALDEMRALGAAVEVYACDVTDAADVERVVAEVTRAWGPVNGVFHLAGIAGDRMVAFREPGDALAVLAPKAAGTANLHRILGGRAGLDFVVYFSSRAATDGLVGGGDYAVANAFLDAAAQSLAATGAPVLSIDWPLWRGAGMAGRSGVDIGGLGRAVRQLAAGDAGQPAAGPAPEPAEQPAAEVWEGELGPATHWVLDEHRVGRMPLLPGTGYLDIVTRVFLERLAEPDSVGVEITEVVFRAPFADQRPRTLRLTFRPVEDRYGVVIESRPAAEDGPWTVHATLTVGGHREAAGRRDLDALRNRFAAVGQPLAASGNDGRLFVMGPRWHNIVDSWNVEAEALLHLRLPAAYRPDLAEHPLHPALLDMATAKVRTAGQAASVPFLYRRLVTYRPFPETIYAHIRRDPDAPGNTPSGDVDLIGEDGVLVATVEGFTMVMVDPERFKESTANPATAAQQTASASAASGPAQADAAPDEGIGQPDGIDPRVGVDLMLRLLDAGVTGQVLVPHYFDGRAQEPWVHDAEPDTVAPDDPDGHGAPTARPAPVVGAPPTRLITPAPASAPVTVGAVAGNTANGASTWRVAAERPTGEVSGGAGQPGGESLETRLAELWRHALGVAEVQPDQDFFDAGGNSLTAVELMARIRSLFGVQLNIGLLLDASTFSRLVAALRERGVS